MINARNFNNISIKTFSVITTYVYTSRDTA